MLEPHGRLNGAALRVANGIVHLFAATISVLEPLQFVKSCEKVTLSPY